MCLSGYIDICMNLRSRAFTSRYLGVPLIRLSSRLQNFLSADSMRHSVQLTLIPPFHLKILFGWRAQHWCQALNTIYRPQSVSVSLKCLKRCMCGCCSFLCGALRLDFLRSGSFLPLQSPCRAGSLTPVQEPQPCVSFFASQRGSNA